MSKNNLEKIVLIGQMGSGKSGVGKLLAEQLGYRFYDADNEIEKKTGVNIPWIFEIEGEEGFRKRERDILIDLLNYNKIVLSTGGGAILSEENRKILAESAFIIYLTVDVSTQLQRLKYDKNRPLLQQSNPEKILTKLQQEREQYYLELAHLTIKTDHLTIAEIVQEIRRQIKK